MTRRRIAGWAAIAVALIALTGCEAAAEPTPSPTPTGFASEEEAFAAAEETYRAYVEESNRALRGVESAEPLDFLAGQALDDERSIQQVFADSGRSLKGEIRIKRFENVSWTRTQVQSFVCLDLNGVRVVDSDGEDVTPRDRSSANLLEIRVAGGERVRVISSVLRSEEC